MLPCILVNKDFHSVLCTAYCNVG